MHIAFTFFLVLIAVILAYRSGWQKAHDTVAKECELLGAFYVGDQVFKCVEVIPGTRIAMYPEDTEEQNTDATYET
jgi:uncharacterized membrane protein